jgi:membrane-bound lytic murein transglycosylase D
LGNIAAFKQDQNWQLMQPQVRALLIAAGLLVLVHSPVLIAADAAAGEQVTLQKATIDPAADSPVAPPQTSVEQSPRADDPPPAEPPVASAAEASQMPTAPQVQPASQVPTVMDLTTTPTSLWQRIRNGFGLPDIASPLVREQEEWYASRPDYIARTVARSSRYLYYIVEQVEKRGMPSEIALLPIIESAYNPVAYSRANASGIWQFIPSTGKLYGLQQNFWYDGRRDVMAATNAALDYLEKLYDMFGSWDLALASYNWGEGAVARAVAKNMAKGLATDYASLNMPAETRYYMPKLQAVKNIIANPAQYGIDLAEVPNQPYFTAVTTTKHIDVKLAAKLADMPVEEFVSLNPGNSRPVIKADGVRTLLIPTDKAGTFLSNLESHDAPLVSWQAYKLKAGDTVARVAARYGIDVAQLKHVNGIGVKHSVGPGATLLVPSGASSTPYLPDMPAPKVTVAKAPKKSAKYASRRGGTVKVSHKIARKPAPAQKTAASTATKKIVLAQKAH